MPHLVNTVQKLYKDRAAVAVVRSRKVTAALVKHMAKREPVFFYYNLKAFNSSEVRVKHHLGNR